MDSTDTPINLNYETLHETKDQFNFYDQIKETRAPQNKMEGPVASANDRAYSSQVVNKYFSTKPLLKQKADKIQYNLDKMEKIGQGNFGIVYKILTDDDSGNEKYSRVLKVIKQTDYTLAVNDPSKKEINQKFESSYLMFLKEFDIWKSMMKCENLNDKIVRVHSLRTCWTNSNYARTGQ